MTLYRHGATAKGAEAEPRPRHNAVSPGLRLPFTMQMHYITHRSVFWSHNGVGGTIGYGAQRGTRDD